MIMNILETDSALSEGNGLIGIQAGEEKWKKSIKIL